MEATTSLRWKSGAAKERLLLPVTISRNEKEEVLLQSSINSVSFRSAVDPADQIDKILCHKFMRFMMMRAENFFILRWKPVEGYDISSHITNLHTEEMYKSRAGGLRDPLHGGDRQGDP